MMSVSIPSIFTGFQDHLDKEQDLREEIRNVIKDIEQCAREVITILQIIHQGGDKDIKEACASSKKIINDGVKPGYQKLSLIFSKDSENQYYRYHDHWRFVTQRLTFVIGLIEYLENGTLVTREHVAETLGVETNRENGFHLDLEDYLMGILQMSSELSRLAVNSVTLGDYSRPIHISKFVTELNAGFRLLNLKNDSLRKRFDALKYDVKKIEEVVYDLTLRGLYTKQEGN